MDMFQIKFYTKQKIGIVLGTLIVKIIFII